MIVAAHTPTSESKVLLILTNYSLVNNEFLELAIGFLNCVISFFEYLSSSHPFFEVINYFLAPKQKEGNGGFQDIWFFSWVCAQQLCHIYLFTLSVCFSLFCVYCVFSPVVPSSVCVSFTPSSVCFLLRAFFLVRPCDLVHFSLFCSFFLKFCVYLYTH